MNTSDSSSAEWYYSDEGRQSGPVSLGELQERARSGRLNPTRDLVWNSSMTEWLPAGRVPELFPGSAAEGNANPYAPPASAVLLAPPPEGMLPEIPPGSQPLDAVECVKRAFTLVNRSLVPLVLVALVYVLISYALQFLLTLLVGAAPGRGALLLITIIGNVVGTFLMLGIIRISLNVVSGREFSVNQLFGEGSKLVPALWPYLALGVGFTILAFAGLPGILLGIVAAGYAVIRFGFYIPLIVDRNMGTMDALKQSFRLTENSALPLIAFYLMLGVIGFLGALACLVGLFYALPVIYVAQAAAYRWLQYGPVALADDHGTAAPVLRGRIPE